MMISGDLKNNKLVDSLDNILIEKGISISPQFNLFGKPPHDIISSISQKSLPEIGTFELNNVYLTGNGLLFDENMALIKSPFLPYSMLQAPAQINAAHNKCYSFEDNRILIKRDSVKEVLSPTALLVQPGDRFFGHWIVDLIPKYLGIKEIYKNQDIHFVIKSDVTSGSAIVDARDLFQFTGLLNESIVDYSPSSEIIFFRKLIVPSVVRHQHRINNHFHTFTNLIKKMCSKANTSNSSHIDKLYLSRGTWIERDESRNLSNRSSIERVFSEKGFTIVNPNNLSFFQKLNLLNHATEIAGEKGSALHLSMFSDSIKKVTVLLSPLESNHNIPLLQASLCTIDSQECNYVYGTNSSNSGYSIDESDLASI
ncbi:hypothetical protein C4K68_25385 [Pokkaliibacter plantistimulans]|uniref:Glycosyltransferase 61 catalytic domain-containing protein n=1 Tax=Proteobacteria bacterium 228 TaxID=2083153 RepID=A0A2S5KJG4_9PROT|nr:glycosyltransferase 61 family protein [Pokkaliibacter plantistimulans]PPC74649.1 hypothetical protein C4K68_25385 [Pokkaliibacter plantistimulans]